MDTFNITNTSPGVIPDPRTAEQKATDFTHSELATALPLKWDRDISTAPTYSQRDQDGSSSCVGQAGAKGIETLLNQVISAHPIYRRRTNYPSEGMWLADMGSIVKKLGTTTEALDPSQGMNEAQMNADVTVATPLKEPIYIMVDAKDVNAIASAIETYKHCMIIIHGNLEEYADFEKPVCNNKLADFGHCICGVYYFTDAAGKRCILADESWGPNNIRRRILTEDYLIARATEGMYFIPYGDKPYHQFNTNLAYGMAGNTEVKFLQDILKYEGLFPKSILSSGNYLQITAGAVLAFQNKYGITPPSANNCGPKTRAKLNSLYGNG